ncbi:MAG: hypothetical protein AAF581_01780 [Planctomycetota bacterium]
MFKLEKSKAEAIRLSKKEPDRFQAGSNQWVTARFRAEVPMPTKLWEKWLNESYELSAAGSKKKTATRR